MNLLKKILKLLMKYLKDMKYRDKNDSSGICALKVADDAIVVDTTGFSLEQSISTLKNLIHEKLGLNDL